MPFFQRFFIIAIIITVLLSACGTSSTPVEPTAIPATPIMPTDTPVMPTATAMPPTVTPTMALPTPIPPFTKPLDEITYRNLFKDYLGKSDAEIQARLDAAWQQLFYGNDDSQRVYYPVGAGYGLY